MSIAVTTAALEALVIAAAFKAFTANDETATLDQTARRIAERPIVTGDPTAADAASGRQTARPVINGRRVWHATETAFICTFDCALRCGWRDACEGCGET